MTEDYLLIAREVLGDAHSFVGLVDAMPRPLSETSTDSDRLAPGDQRIVDAARTTSQITETSLERDKKLIRYLIKNRHTTPLEFVRLTFHIRMPIFVARQWVRHRMASINEESARYSKLRSDFYVPTLERVMAGGQGKKNRQGSGEPIDESTAHDLITYIENAGADAYAWYEMLLDSGLAKELARSVLPVNIYTQWYWTTDLHNLMHFLTLRTHEHAQWEIRQYADRIVEMAKRVAPVAMEAWEQQQ